MAFQVSPGVAVKEIDLTNVIPAVSTSIGGFAGYFRWGPLNEPTLVSSESQMAKMFGTPGDDNLYCEPYFQADGFLKYGNALRVVRAGSSDNFDNAVDSSTESPSEKGIYIPNLTYFEENTITANGATFAARYPGDIANGLEIYVVSKDQFNSQFASPAEEADSTESAVLGAFDIAPEDDEVHVAIVDAKGNFSAEAGSIVETYQGLSLTKGAKKADGAANFLPTVLNKSSEYVYYVGATNDDIEITDISEDLNSPINYTSLINAVTKYTLRDGSAPAGDDSPGGLIKGDITGALDLLADAETLDVNLIFSQIGADATIQNYAHQIAYTRKDAIAFLSPPVSYTVGVTNSAAALKKVLEFGKDEITNRTADGSYGVMDSGALYIYDKYNDIFRYIPANGHMAGLCANTDDVAAPWFSPAGLNRGGIRGITKLAYNPKQVDRDELYKAGINPLVSFPGQGTVLFGDKTAQAKPSAFDRINVRRLFITLEKAIATAAKYQLFELNDAFTRATFVNAVEPFLRGVQAGRGITDFLVVCDETNNTGEVIDTNRFVADIFIKPARSINFITLNFVATRTGVDFGEIVGLSNG
jgi:phage tail sheath protein FI